MKLSGNPETVRGIAHFQFRIEFVCCLEESDVQCPPVALEPVAQCCKSAILVHPLAQVSEDLFACLVPVQRL